MHDALLTGKQLAAYLNVNERTVQKLVADGSLPGVKVGNQWRFRRAMIDTWLDDQMLGVAPRFLAEPQKPGEPHRRMLALDQCFKPDYILPAMFEQTKPTVIEELAAFAARLGLPPVDAALQVVRVEDGHAAHVAQPFETEPAQIRIRAHHDGEIAGERVHRANRVCFILRESERAVVEPLKCSRPAARACERDAGARPEAVRSLLAAPDPQRMYEVLAQAELALAVPHPDAVTS